ncbi:VanZ family protein [Bailinhaonella thermotolerans]|uniref:VanZ family protein n=1 Tax=Bailinhaonella thermotolerans TaxID=1070861 RepID=UPI00192A19C7|nr:VanZ family protein [Bailinhaonella thermotolerans]
MDVYVSQGRIALFLTPLAIVVCALPFVARQYRRFGRVGLWPGLVAAAMVLYACGVAAFALFPLPEVTPGFCQARETLLRPRWELGASVRDILRESAGGLGGLPAGRAALRIVFDVLLFAPLGFLLWYRYRAGLARTALAGLAGSALVETSQLTGLWGLYPCAYRLFDADDLVINTAGAVLGWAVAVPLARGLPSAWPIPPSPDLSPPGAGRRLAGLLLDGVLWLLAAPLVTMLLARAWTWATGGAPPFTPPLAYAVTGLALFVVVPAVRRDAATPGLAAVHVAVAGTGWRRRARLAPPYLAIVAGGVVAAASSPLAAMALAGLVGVLELERRGLLAQWTGTEVVTRRALDLAAEFSPGPAPLRR